MRSTTPFRNALWTLTLVAMLVASPLAARGTEAASPYDEVLRLLEGELAESVILAWLEGREEPLPRPTADQLLALKEAGASDDLLAALLAEAATAGSASQKAPPQSESPPATAAPETPPAAAAPPATAEPSAPPESQAPGESGDPEVEFELSYRLDTGDDSDTWSFYVYLDGKPLSYVPLSTLISNREPLRFRQRLAPGRHVLRVALERHEVDDDGETRHLARFAPEPMLFNLSPGSPARLEVTFRDNALTAGVPVSWSFQQGIDRDERSGVGGDPERWPYLCGELEGRSDRDTCRTWEELWRDLDPSLEATTRQDVLRALELFNYRPVPIDS